MIGGALRRWGRGCVRVLEGAVAAPEVAIGRLELLSASERRQVLEDWNATGRAVARGTLVDEFAAQAAARPDAVAAVFEDARLSYGELEARANQLAHHLRALGVGAETVVGLCLERSLEMLVGLIGILKAGGAYLPLDPSYPAERLAFMLEDAGAALVITSAALGDRLGQHGARRLELDTQAAALAESPRARRRSRSRGITSPTSSIPQAPPEPQGRRRHPWRARTYSWRCGNRLALTALIGSMAVTTVAVRHLCSRAVSSPHQWRRCRIAEREIVKDPPALARR